MNLLYAIAKNIEDAGDGEVRYDCSGNLEYIQKVFSKLNPESAFKIYRITIEEMTWLKPERD